MRFTGDQFFLTGTYLTGINIYYALWYLGSEGGALHWGEPGLDLWSHLIAANAAALLNVTILVSLLNSLGKKSGAVEMPRVAPLIFILSLMAFGVLFSLILALQAFWFGATSILTFFQSKVFVSLLLHHLVLAGLMMLLHLVIHKSGGARNFFSQLFQKRPVPKPVERGFAFIDMNGSTQIAQILGHARYSDLIGACFRLLDDILEDYPPYDIYQYVGDEAIITWEVELARSEDAVGIFQDFAKAIRSQAPHFQAKYGLVPTFKCAIHSGEVMESELGSKNPQKAYHGDVLNMASRILGLCHTYQTSLLLSQDYKKRISSESGQSLVALEHEFINGKSRKMLLYKPISKSIIK